MNKPEYRHLAGGHINKNIAKCVLCKVKNQRDRLKLALEATQWGSYNDCATNEYENQGMCPYCSSYESDGHTAECIVGKALASV